MAFDRLWCSYNDISQSGSKDFEVACIRPKTPCRGGLAHLDEEMDRLTEYEDSSQSTDRGYVQKERKGGCSSSKEGGKKKAVRI